MRSCILFLFLAASSVGFARNPTDTSLYNSTGRQKAIVAVMPVIDHSGEKNIPWDITRELTNEMRNRVYDSTKLYLLKEGGSLELAEKLNQADLDAIPSDVKNSVGAAEFIVVMEVLEEKETPYGKHMKTKNHEAANLLSLAMRLRVIDVRNQPKVILQEVLHHDDNVAQSSMNMNYNGSLMGSESYERTPLGMAYSRILREAYGRIEGYIEAAR